MTDFIIKKLPYDRPPTTIICRAKAQIATKLQALCLRQVLTHCG